MNETMNANKNSGQSLNEARENLLKHSRSKKNGQEIKFTHHGQLTNPLCGDHVKLFMRIENNFIQELGFSAKACAICTASASMLCEELNQVSAEKAQLIAEEFEENLIAPSAQVWPAHLHALRSFEHLKVNPSRLGCAILPWIVLKNTLKAVVL